MARLEGQGARKIVVTGAGGYIGLHLCRRALDQGFAVTSLGRQRPDVAADQPLQHATYALGDAVPSEALAGATAVIHLASAGIGSGDGADANMIGTEALAAAARDAGVARFIFVSSQAARADAPTQYGRGKFAVERMLEGYGAVVVRPGLVVGGDQRGVYGTLCSMLRSSAFLPVTGASAPVQPIHVDQLSDALLALAAPDAPSDVEGECVFRLGAPVPIRFQSFLRQLAWLRFGRRVALLPFPLPVMLAGAAVARAIPGLPNIPRERIMGLSEIPVMETQASFAALGLAPGDWRRKLAAEARGGRRNILREGLGLMTYVLGRRPDRWLLRRYARAVARVGDGGPLMLPRVALAVPALMRLFEPVGGAGPRADRLRIAALIVETTPAGAERFAAQRPRSRAAAMLELAVTAALEGLCMPFRLLLARRGP